LGESVTKKSGENTIFVTSDAATDARSLQGSRLSRAEDVQGAKGSTDTGTVPKQRLTLEHDRVCLTKEEVPESDKRRPTSDGHPTDASVESGRNTALCGASVDYCAASIGWRHRVCRSG
jgi:hypothetical protein